MRDNLEEKIYDLENNFRQCDEYLETIDKNIEDIKRKYNNAQQEKANIMEKIKEVQLDNESKRRFISTQKMSGEEARARRIERDNLRQHHGDLKARLKEAESRKENIQPDLYKETSKVDDKFKDFVSRLREVTKEVFDNEEQDIVNQVAELDSKNEDFSQNDLGKCRHAINLVATRIDVKFSKLLADCQGARSKCEEACRFISKCNETIDKIGIETARSTTQFQRDFEDIRKDLHQANLEIDCLLQKANLISESIGKLINEGKELLNRNAEIKMKYDQKKRLRENEFQEIVAKLSEKLSIVWDEHIALRNEAMTFSKTAKEMNKAARKIEQMWNKLDSENNTEE
uniref:Uncharacterized protein n=1 Tax=Acrobeloides nanus TaxID=290746 RepID=A0A914E221_9BILA